MGAVVAIAAKPGVVAGDFFLVTPVPERLSSRARGVLPLGLARQAAVELVCPFGQPFGIVARLLPINIDDGPVAAAPALVAWQGLVFAERVGVFLVNRRPIS